MAWFRKNKVAPEAEVPETEEVSGTSREEALAAAREMLEKIGDSKGAIEKKEKLAKALTGSEDQDAADAVFINSALLGVESLYLPFGVGEGDADTGPVSYDSGYYPWYIPEGADLTPTGGWRPPKEWPPSYPDSECGEILKPVNEGFLEPCHLKPGHEGKHGRDGVIYEHPKKLEPIIVGTPPNSALGKILRTLQDLQTQIESYKKSAGL